MAGNTNNFSVEAVLDESLGAVVISGIPIASGTPTDAQYIGYVSAASQWQYKTLPNAAVFAATGAASLAVTPNSDITLQTDGVIVGTDITRSNASVFTLAPGTYRLQFQTQSATWTAPAPSDLITFQFYDQTNTTVVGNIGQITSVSGTSVGAGTVETIAQFSGSTNISVRAITVTGGGAALVSPSVNIYKLN